MAEEILKMVNITKRFADTTTLDRVQFPCSKGEVHMLAGENGARKGTILKIPAGVHQADEEEIYFHGKKVEIRSPGQSQKLGIAMAFQELTLVEEMTVQENIYLNQKPVTCLGRISRREIKKRILDVMDRYGIHIDPDATVGNLPVAEQQMAEILRILIRDPELIILDEPTSTLAKEEIKQLYQIIHSLIVDGRAIIFISHHLEELFELGHRITVFKGEYYIGARNMDEINEDDLMHIMVGRSLNHVFPPSVCQVDHSQVIFEVKNLVDADHKLSHVSFQIHKGEILGVAGLQGHGQTEILNAVNGLYPLSEGKTIVNGKQVGIKNTGQAIANGVALVPSDRKNQGLMLELSGRHNLSISNIRKRTRGCFIDKKVEQAFDESMASRLSIRIGELDLPVSSFSGGNQQKVVPGKELATEPKVILFGEPTRGINVEAKQKFYQVIHGLAAQGVAVVMNPSDMPEVISMSSRAIVIYEGRISSILEKEDLTEERVMQPGVGLGNNKRVRRGEEQDK